MAIRKSAPPLCALALLVFASYPAMADTTLPTGGTVVSGAASINTNANSLIINQSTQNAAINWNSFSVGSEASVNFVQPSTSSITLNRVTGSEQSIINGSLNANGQVFLLNSNGVLIGNGASINAGGVVASSMSMSDDDFNAGNYVLNNNSSTASVINQGTITASDGGYVVLAGQKVSNEGVINARLGHVALASGEKVSLNFNGNSLVSVNVDKETVDALVENKQAIYADGGVVTMTAKAANKALESVVNNEGIIQAHSISKKNGVIHLDGGSSGEVLNSGVLDVSGKSTGESGGSIVVEGNIIHQAGAAKLDASGSAGGGTILIGGDYQGKNTAIHNSSYNSVDKDVTINVDAIDDGDGGKAILWSDKNTYFNGTITAKGGAVSGNGGNVEVSGKDYLGFRGHVDTTAQNGNDGILLLDPADIVVQAGTGDGAADGTNTFKGVATAGTVAAVDAGPSTIYESELQGIAAATNISVAASNSITFNAFSDGVLSLAQTAGRTATFTAGTGNITMANLSDTIQTAGGALNFTSTSGGVTLGNLSSSGGAITVNVGNTSTISGTIAGTGTAFTKSGTGSLLLSGNNTYTGATNLSAGSVIIGNNNAFGTGTVSIGTVSLSANGAPVTVANTLSGTGNATFTGSSDISFTGALTNTSSRTYTNNMTSLLSLGDINLSNSATSRTMTFAGTGDITVNGVIANGGGSTASAITKSGTGTLTLNGANTYGGTSTLSAGTVAIENNSAFGTGTVSLSTVTLSNNGAARTISNALTVAGNPTFTGTSDLTFSGLLTQTGNRTFLNNMTGILRFGDIDLSNSVSNRNITFTGTGDTVVNGVIANGGGSVSGGIIKNGNGKLTLNGSNTFGGTTTVNVGTLEFGNDNALGTGSLSLRNANFMGNGVTHTISNTLLGDGAPTFIGTSDLIFTGNLNNSGNRTFTNDMTGTLSFNNINLSNSATNVNMTLLGTGNTVVNGIIANGGTSTASTFTKGGTGTLTLNGTNTYGGLTNFNAGTIIIGNNAAFGTGSFTWNGGTLQGNGVAKTLANTISLAASSTVSGASDLTFNGLVTNTFAGDPTLTINNSGLTSFGSINLSNSATSRTLTLAGTGNTTINGVIANGSTSTAGAVVNSNSGTLTLNGANTYGGGTSLDAGTTVAGNNAAFGTGTLTLNGGSLRGNGVAKTLANTISLAASSTVSGASDLTFNGLVTNTFAGDPTLTINNSGLTSFGSINLSNSATSRTLTLAGTGNTTINGVIANGSTSTAGAVVNSNSGTLTLNGANTYGGGTSLDAGTTVAGNNAAFGTGTLTLNGGSLRGNGVAKTLANTISLAASSTVSGASDLTFNGLVTNTFAGDPTLIINNSGLTSFGSINLSNSATSRTLTLAGTGNTTVTGVIADGGGSTGSALTKAGAGTLTLSGANSYSGDTTLNAGTLRYGANNAIAAGNVIVNDGATYDLNGFSDTIGALTVNSGATGGSVSTGAGTLTLGGNISSTGGASNASIAGNLNLGSAGRTITTTNAADGLTISAIIAGAQALTKAGAGTLTLSGANSYSGATLLSAGTIDAAANNIFSASTDLTLSASTILNMNGFSTGANSINASGDVNLGTGSTITTAGSQIYSGVVTGNNTTLNSSAGGNIAANNVLNDFTGDLSGSTTGAFSARDANALALGNISASSIDLRSLAGNLTLNGVLNASSAVGTSVSLVSSNNFINNTGAGAISTAGAARWLVYSTSPLSDTLGGLTRNFKQYNSVLGDTILGSGNGSIYSIAPSVTFGLTGTVSKPFDGTTTATLAAGNYITTSGEIDGDVVTSNQPSSGTYDTSAVGTGKTVTVTGLSVASAANGATTVYGYGLTSTSAAAPVGTITSVVVPPPPPPPSSGGGSSAAASSASMVASAITQALDPVFDTYVTGFKPSAPAPSTLAYSLMASLEQQLYQLTYPHDLFTPAYSDYLTHIIRNDNPSLYKTNNEDSPAVSGEDYVFYFNDEKRVKRKFIQ